MKDKKLTIILFLFINFLGLYLGSLATTPAVISDWYLNLQKAPWTPQGWFFGVAWSTIMICFAFYMAAAVSHVNNTKKLLTIYAIQWLLNLLWNPIFFYYHSIKLGLLIILSLTCLIIFITIYYKQVMKFKNLLILPYLLWMVIASSLNLYIFIYN